MNAQTPNSASRWQLSWALIFMVIMASFSGCSKPETESPAVATPTVDPKHLILEFLSAVGHGVLGEQREDECLSADSAVWYIEAALNWCLTASDRTFNDLRTDTIYATLQMADGLVSPASIESAYGPVSNTVMGYTTEEQNVALVDVFATSIGAQEVTLRIVSYIGSGYERESPPSAVYASNDWRRQGNYTTNQPNANCVCGNQPLPSVRCMDGEIQYRTNAANPPQNGFVFINVESWTVGLASTNLSQKRYRYDDPFMQNPNDPGNDGCFETLTYSWWSFYNCSDWCTSPAVQSYWTNSTWSAIDKIRDQNCPSKNFKLCTVLLNYEVPQGFIEPWYMHTCSFTYGNVIAK